MLDMLDPVDLSNIQDENARQLIDRLLNLIEAVSADLRNAQAEIQQLRDEINRLKGEQGKPNIKANKPKPPWSNYSRWNRSVANPSRTGSAPRKQRSGSIANRSWKWTRPACQRVTQQQSLNVSEAAPQNPLAGTRWQVTSLSDPEVGGIGLVLPGSNLTMAFSSDGKVNGSSGCNS